MQFNEFEKSMFFSHVHRPDALTYAMLGLAGEAGEVVDAYKKTLRNLEAKDIPNTCAAKAMLGELGDVLWYIARVANELGSSLEDVARFNMEKMEFRKKFGKEEGDRQHAASRRTR